jgi:hypothetical protein
MTSSKNGQGQMIGMIGESPGRKLVKSEQFLEGSSHSSLQLLSFAVAPFHRLGCGKLPIAVRLGA